MIPDDIHRLHCTDGDQDDLGWYAKGHHSESEFRAALAARFDAMRTPEGELYRHLCEADETRCVFVQQWWRCVPRRDGSAFTRTHEHARGAFRISALLVPECDLL